MAMEKRKAPVPDRPAKKIKFDDAGNPRTVTNGTVHHRKEDKKITKPVGATRDKPKNFATASNGKDTSGEEKKARQGTDRKESTSLLSGAERSFPRGGASVLTPFEQRQVKADADQDVLFEESGKSKIVRDEYGEDLEGAKEKKPGPRKRGRGKNDQPTGHMEKEARLQGLSYKVLTVGSLVLGQVTKITSKDVALALPNNLTGYIPITAVSDRVNERIQALIAEDGEGGDGSDAEAEAEADVDLKKLFRIGQFLRASVSATMNDAPTRSKSKRHIELSVNPRQANAGLGVDLAENYMVQASVRSVEDHGLVMDVPIEDEILRGFISKKQLGHHWKLDEIQEGQVMLCCVSGNVSEGKVINLCPDPTRIGDLQKRILKSAPTIDPIIPGVAVELLVTNVTDEGLAGKIMGSIDATADSMHSGRGRNKEAFQKIKVGQKVTARVLFNFVNSEPRKVGVSLLGNMRKFEEQAKSTKKTPKVEASQIVDEAKVTSIVPGSGIYFDIGAGSNGYAHISRLSDEKVEALFESTGPFALDTVHKARVLGFNPVDDVYNLSLEASILNRKFLQLEEVRVGSVVDGKVDKIILGSKGITGILVTLQEGITGLVPELHMADVKLQHPERKFRENLTIKEARVLSVDLDRRQLRLTLKKALIRSELAIWKDYNDIQVGDESVGTIIKVQPNGAVMQFYGHIRAWLPVSQMSEAYIADATQHYQPGQAVTVHAKQVDPAVNELIVSCRGEATLSDDQMQAWDSLKVCQVVSAKVSELAENLLTVELDPGLKGLISLGHISDASPEKNSKLLKQMRVDQTLSELVVIGKNPRQHTITLSRKASLIKAAQGGDLIKVFADAKSGTEVAGFVRNMTPDGVFVEFANGLVGYMPKTQIPKERLAQPAFGFRKDASLTAKILSVDALQQRFVLTLRDDDTSHEEPKQLDEHGRRVENAVDGTSASIDDFTAGKTTKARITSVKDTQLNVQLADNVQGRIDASEAFNGWSEIKNRKKPLSKFRPKQVLDVKVLGVHDAKNHRYLPITHRHSRIPVFELSAKSGPQEETLKMSDIKSETEYIAFVNNVEHDHLWANITPNIRGRLSLLDIAADSSIQDIATKNPVGSALRVTVKSADANQNRLDLRPAGSSSIAPQSLNDVAVDGSYAAKVVRVTDRTVLAALSSTVSGIADLTSISDDFGTASTARFSENDIIRVSVVDVDLPNKRLFLSTRPSKVLSSSLPVVDPQITALTQLQVGDVKRGFIKLLRANGIVVALGPRVEAFVKVAELSDQYIKDWQSEFEVGKLVKGRVLEVEEQLNHALMSLKASKVEENYVPPRKLEDLEKGEIVTGRVRKIEDFGVFVDVDDTQPRVSGLCHRTEIADTKISDLRGLFDVGDKVKAKILSIDPDKKRISFGLKASYFKDDINAGDHDMESKDGSEEAGVNLEGDGESVDMDVDGGVDVAPSDAGYGIEDAASDTSMPEAPATTRGLTTNGFDWTGTATFKNSAAETSRSPSPAPAVKSTKSVDPTAPYTDQTGTLDQDGPQTPSDFERLLLSAPHSSSLWIQYMAHHLRLSEVSTARALGRRALSTIPLREQDEKRAIWLALLNLEVQYAGPTTDGQQQQQGGEDDEALASTFRDACAVQDPLDMHLDLASILAQAGGRRFDQAERLYDAMLAANPADAAPVFAVSSSAAAGVGGGNGNGNGTVTGANMAKRFRAERRAWVAFATFLFAVGKRDKARALLGRALKSLPRREAREVTVDFAMLEFEHGSESGGGGGDRERGRTVMEGVVEGWPRWNVGWDRWLQAEEGVLKRLVAGAAEEEEEEDEKGEKGDEEERRDQVVRVRGLFERMTKGRMKTRRAKAVFKRWNEFEKKYGSERDAERVLALTREWVENAKKAKDGEDGDDAEE